MIVRHCDICGVALPQNKFVDVNDYPIIIYKVMRYSMTDWGNYDLCPNCSKMVLETVDKIIEDNRLPNVPIVKQKPLEKTRWVDY